MVNINSKIINWLAIAGGIILADFFYFPVGLKYFPSAANSKMIMAVVAIILLLITKASRQEPIINKKFILLCLLALGVSLTTYVTTVINGTHDNTYVTYIVSMLVWLGGAYTFVSYVKWVHGEVSVLNVTLYLIAACTVQCILAILFDRYPLIDHWACQIFPGQEELAIGGKDAERLYGIACAYDVAGMRLAAVLFAMSCISIQFLGDSQKPIWNKILFMMSFLCISVIGNMISRTASLGVIFGLIYICYALSPFSKFGREKKFMVRNWFLGIFLLGVPTIFVLYGHDATFQKQFRFGFEGFFSLAESGDWNVRSNKQLEGMMILPDNLKTWLIGDGLFFDTTQEPYYVGKHYKGYYMGTDVGYSRFLFYSGIMGLGSFIIFMCYSCVLCCQEFPHYKQLFIGLLLIQFLIWIKVSSDIFVIFAAYIACGFIRDSDERDLKEIDKKENELLSLN